MRVFLTETWVDSTCDAAICGHSNATLYAFFLLSVPHSMDWIFLIPLSSQARSTGCLHDVHVMFFLKK